MKKILGLLLFTILTAFSLVIPGEALAVPPQNFQINQIVGDGLDGPSGFEIAPDGRVFILERTGLIKVVKNGQLLATPFANLPSVASGDRGLIGIAFDPGFGVDNHYVYFYYTGTDLLNRLVRFDASGDVGTNGPFTLYQTNSPSQELHVGGSIQFGPDGKLYFAVGDNGYPPNAQILSNPHGKILRINKDGSIPLDNPFIGQQGALPEIWAYGFRNPWRFQFDKATGNLFGADVGDFTWEEMNQIRKGQNYGWPNYEGPCNAICGTTIAPFYAYNHNGDSASVTGGPIYRGQMFPAEYQGNVFFGDYAQGFIKRITVDANGNAQQILDFDLNAGSVVDMKIAPDGSMYFITYYPGRLYRIAYATGNQQPKANASVDKAKGIDPHTANFSSAGTTDPDGNPLTYLWDFGDGTTSIQANPTKTFTVKGTYTVELTVSDGTNTANAVPLVIQVGNPPMLTVGAPNEGSTYRAGDTINYTSHAIDAAGFDMNDGAIKTEILLHHNTHIHPFLGPFTGRAGSFKTPEQGEASADTWFEIKVTVTDENGLTDTKSVNVYPIKSNITLNANIAGLKVFLDGAPVTTPYTTAGVEKFKREISVPTIQEFNGTFYQFEGWSDGGAPRHQIITPAADTTYTAIFTQAPSYKAEFFNNTTLTGAPVVTRQDAEIDFVWGADSPAAGVNPDQHSIRWTKNQYFAAGRYKFITATDDGVRLFIDGQQVINEFHGGNASYNATVDLTTGTHEIRMEYLEEYGLANARLEYELTQDQPSQQVAGYTAQYFNNRTLNGQPTFTRNEATINNTFGNGSPDASINADNFSARWTRNVILEAGTYTFTATADDGIRVIIDGEVVIDKFIDQGPTTYTANKTLTAGNHAIVVEYYEAAGGAVAKFDYEKTANVPPPVGGFTAQYFNNTTLAGAPVLTRNEAVINNDYGAGSPNPVVTVDNFSARWTKTDTLAAGTYEFTVTGDDGVRLLVDGEVIIDKFIPQAPTTYKISKALVAGNHTIVLEYFESGGGAVAKLNYAATTTPPPPTDGYVGQYYNNKEFLAPIVVTKTNAAIDFDWGGGSPDALIDANNFSIRWTKTITTDAGTYAFTATADDGIRVLVDGEVVINGFVDQAPTTYTAQKVLTAGNHTVVIEYYENGGGAVAKFNYEKVTGIGIPNPNPNPAPTENKLTIFDNTLAAGWDNWSWNSVINFANTNPVYAGLNSIKYTATGMWSGMYLHNAAGTNTTNYNTLHFVLQAGQANANYAVFLFGANGEQLSEPKPLETFGGNPTVGNWKVYDIPLADLNGTNKVITGIVLHDRSGNAQSVLYTDDVTIIQKN
ncbi:MAG: PQQ-dependent sugar dehydrogenase [Candidatus Levybacteria bacterium]|nr:PQQ-dependent sugar dehydrogenase [Candidatus Levybacteria bacterium]